MEGMVRRRSLGAEETVKRRWFAESCPLGISGEIGLTRNRHLP